MAETIRGINVVIGAETTGLSKALSDVNKKSRDIQSELKQVEKLLKLDPTNTELLAQRQKLLSDAVANTSEKLNRLKTVQEQVNQQFQRGEISEGQYRAFQREIVKTEQELQKLEQQGQETKRSLADLGVSLQNAGDKLRGVGQTMTLAVTTPIVGAGVAAFKMAADLKDAIGATEQIFKGAADNVKNWADGLAEYYGISEGEALDYANMMGALLQNIGKMSAEEAAKQAQTLVQLAGDLTAMFGGTTEQAVQALTGALKGNTEMLDNYGIACNDALIKTKALEMGIYDGKGEMDLAAKQAAILALIMEQTGAAQGQAAREADGASGSMREFTTAVKNLATDIGDVLLPVITPFIQKLKDIVGAFGELSPSTQKAIIAIAGIAAAIGPLLMIFGPVISAIGTLIIGLGAMSTAMAGGATFVAALSSAFPALGAAITLITGPIGIAIAAIAALITAGVLIYKNWDTIKEKLSQAWNAIKETAEKVWSAIKDFFKKWGDEILLIAIGPAGWVVLLAKQLGANWDTIKKTAENIWNTLKSTLSNAWNSIKTTASSVWDSIKNAILRPIEDAKAILMQIIDSIKSAFANMKITIPKPKLPHITVSTAYKSIGGISIPYPDFDINWYAQGGIFTRPSIIGVGEAGPEAVIPLDKSGGIGGITVNMYGPVTVRDDQDIHRIARELFTLQQRAARAKGLA